MPELPEVETIRSGLEASTTNRRIEKCDVLLARTIAFPDSPFIFARVSNIRQSAPGIVAANISTANYLRVI